MTKAGRSDQHQLLHWHFPGDCCLCTLEDEKSTKALPLLRRALKIINKEVKSDPELSQDISDYLLGV